MEAKYDFERKYREQILQCSRCGFCQANCPVYGLTLRPALNARGKMLILKEVMEGKIDLGDDVVTDTEGFSDTLRRDDLEIVTLPVEKAQSIELEALIPGDGQCGGGIEPTG